MRTFLVSRWFLLLLGVGVSAAIGFTDWLRPLVTPIPLRLVVATTLLLMAWTLESRRLWEAVRRPWPALAALVVSYGIPPALAWSASHLFASADYRVGLLVMAGVPCTLASAVIWTRLGGGNEAVALLATLLTTSVSWLVTTGWLTATTGTVMALESDDLMRDLAVFLVLPAGLGQLARSPAALRRAADRGKPALNVVSRLLIFAMVLQAVVRAADGLRQQDGGDQLCPVILLAVVSVANHSAALASGFWGGRVLGFDRASCIAIAFAGSQKTLPVALMLVESCFPLQPLAVVPVLFYHVGQLVVDSLVVDVLNPRAGANLATDTTRTSL